MYFHIISLLPNNLQKKKHYVKKKRCRLLPTAPNSANTSALLCVRDGCHFSRAWRNTKNCMHIYRQYINSHTEIKRNNILNLNRSNVINLHLIFNLN